MDTIIDRRSSGTRATANQDRLQRRVRSRLKEAVEKMAGSGSLKDLASSEHTVSVPTRDLNEPGFHKISGESWNRVFPGNKTFNKGDEIEKPQGGGGSPGRKASPDGLGNDEILVQLSTSDFMDILFEGLKLPRLRKTAEGDTKAEQSHRAGFIKDGSPSRMHVGRTMRAARSRRLALRAGKTHELHILELEKEALEQERQDLSNSKAHKAALQAVSTKLEIISEKIIQLERKIRSVPFIDETDLRFSHLDQQPKPITNAVMFCIMDISGSMGEIEKDLSKRFFLLLYLFLKRQYQAVEIVFIKHHSTATECSEEAFFGAQEGGGTLVSPALILTQNIIAQRYPTDRWNVYVAQTSDGDNYPSDNVLVTEHLQDLLQQLRGYFFLEVNSTIESSLFQTYARLTTQFPELRASRAKLREEIYPLFRELFSQIDDQQTN